jgi:hypothetical protein
MGNMHFMLECLVSSNAEAGEDGIVSRASSVVLNPGVRFALNLGHLQVVPGIAIPVTFADGGTERAVFIYVSFEHPY